MNYMTWENLSDFAFVNTDTLTGDIKGVVVNFHGYTDASMFTKSGIYAESLGKKGIIYIFPYYSVWSWYSKSSMAFVEEVIDTVYAHFALPSDIPFMTTGGSMGGMVAMLYGVYGKRKICACACNCPVTDLVIRMRDHNMVRAIYSAYNLEDKPFEQCVREHSPIHMAEKFARVPYKFVFGGADGCITPEQSVPFCEKMRECGHKFTSETVSEMVHCDILSHKLATAEYIDFVIDQIYRNCK